MSDSITCPRCQLTSYNPNDIQYRFCIHCGYHDDMIDALHRMLARGPMEISWELTDGQDLYKEVDPRAVAMVEYNAVFWMDIGALGNCFKDKYRSGGMSHEEFRAEMHELHKMKMAGPDWDKFDAWWASKSEEADNG